MSQQLDMFSNYSSSYWNSCINFMESAREQVLVTGITGLVCFILLMLLLVFEILYICRYKTTFLQRLFFHLTIIVDSTNAINLMYLGYSAYSLSEESCYSFTRALGIILSYAYTAEVIVVTFINVSLLSTMFKYHFERRSLHTSTPSRYCLQQRCWSKKHAEVIAVCIIFVGPLSAVAVGIFLPDVWVYFTGLFTDNSTRTFLLFFAPGTYALILSLISTVVMIAWLCSLRRKGLSKNWMKLVCREIGLVVGILAAYSVLMFLVAVLPFYPSPVYALCTTIVHSCIPLIFLVYVCTHINNSRKKAHVQLNNVQTIAQPTVPPSTRVSLPSDTAEHAPNFLSPSTAEPTDVTPLLKH